MSDNFINRWSRRKLDARDGKPLAEPEPHKESVAQPLEPASFDGLQGAVAESALPVPESVPVKLPTLEDTQVLTPESDFKPFMAQGVTAEVKNAAMKKLFTDPHFNVMDRLDTYIDDYSISEPIPESMLRKMASAKFLNLFDDEPDEKGKEEALARDVPDTAPGQVMAQSTPELKPQPETSPETPPEYDHPDLQLQPNHALEPQGLGRGTA